MLSGCSPSSHYGLGSRFEDDDRNGERYGEDGGGGGGEPEVDEGEGVGLSACGADGQRRRDELGATGGVGERELAFSSRSRRPLSWNWLKNLRSYQAFDGNQMTIKQQWRGNQMVLGG